MQKYILGGGDGRQPVPASLMEWAEWFERSERHVAKTQIGEATVSTVFLGIDHGFGGEPLLFETMIFGGKFDGYQERSATWAKAEEQHHAACAMARGKMDV